MLENPKRVKCLDECNIGPHNCSWPWPCLHNEPSLHYVKKFNEFVSKEYKLFYGMSDSDIVKYIEEKAKLCNSIEELEIMITSELLGDKPNG